MDAVDGKVSAQALHGAARAESSLSAQLLRQDLLHQEAASAFTASGKLSLGALVGSRKIMEVTDLKNANIPRVSRQRVHLSDAYVIKCFL